MHLSDRCHFCRCSEGKHDPDCPVVDPRNKADYDAGWAVGRKGLDHPMESMSNAWTMGWANGNSGFEEAENGYDPRFD